MLRFPAPTRHPSVLGTALLAALGLAAGAGAASRVVASGAFAQGGPTSRSASFRIAAALPLVVIPGRSQAVDMRLTNPHHYPLAVTRLTLEIVVDPKHELAGCDRHEHFRAIRMPPASYPLVLRARQSTTLRRLGVAVLPRVAMLDLASQQDACKGARLSLLYGGQARRVPGAGTG